MSKAYVAKITVSNTPSLELKGKVKASTLVRIVWNDDTEENVLVLEPFKFPKKGDISINVYSLRDRSINRHVNSSQVVEVLGRLKINKAMLKPVCVKIVE